MQAELLLVNVVTFLLQDGRMTGCIEQVLVLFLKCRESISGMLMDAISETSTRLEIGMCWLYVHELSQGSEYPVKPYCVDAQSCKLQEITWTLQSAHGMATVATAMEIWESICSAQTLVEATAHSVFGMLESTSDHSIMDSGYRQWIQDLDGSKLIFENSCMHGIHNWLTTSAIEVIMRVKSDCDGGHHENRFFMVFLFPYAQRFTVLWYFNSLQAFLQRAGSLQFQSHLDIAEAPMLNESFFTSVSIAGKIITERISCSLDFLHALDGQKFLCFDSASSSPMFMEFFFPFSILVAAASSMFRLAHGDLEFTVSCSEAGFTLPCFSSMF